MSYFLPIYTNAAPQPCRVRTLQGRILAFPRKRSISLYDASVWILLVWCVFQDFVIGLFYANTGLIGGAKLLLHFKDALMVTLFLVAIFKTRIPSWVYYLMLPYFTLIALHFSIAYFSSGIAVFSLLASIRGLILLPVLGVIGYAIDDTERFFNTVIRRYFPFLVVVAAIGIVEYAADNIVGTKAFWTEIVGLGDMIAEVKGQAIDVLDGLPGNFYTYSSMGFFTQKRLVSIWGTPLTSGYCLLIPAVYYAWAVIVKPPIGEGGAKASDILSFVVVSVALVLTFTRATIVLFAVVIVALLVYSTPKQYRVLTVLLIIAGGFLLAVFKWDSVSAYLYNGSTARHISSAFNSIIQVSFFGSGVASFGSHLEGMTVGTESAFITVFGQLGVMGGVLYILMLLIPVARLFKRRSSKPRAGSFMMVLAILGLAYCVTGLVSEQLSAFTSIAQFLVLLGFASSLLDKECGFPELDCQLELTRSLTSRTVRWKLVR